MDRGVAEEDSDLAGRGSIVKGFNARLVLIDPSSRTDKYHVIQGLQDQDAEAPKNFYCFQRWGQTGQRGSNKVDGPMDKPKLESIFAKVFLDKTGKDWGAMAPGDRAKPGKYWVQQWCKPNEKARWEYWVDDGVDGKRPGWYPYESNAGEEVEAIHAQHVANARDGRTGTRIVQSDYFAYEVNLENMTQANTRTRKTRNIRRVLGQASAAPPAIKAVQPKGVGKKIRTAKAAMKVAGAMKAVMKKATKKKAMKAMKAMKPMKKKKKAMKKASIIATGKYARRAVFQGRKTKTSGGMRASDLVKNKGGKIVTKKASDRGRKNHWAVATKEARKALGITGFVPVGGKTDQGKALLAKAREIYAKK